MKTHTRSGLRWFALHVAALASAFATEAVDPSIERTQVIELNKGWNAVYLEVAPLDASPAKVFASLPVDMAAVFFAGNTVSEQYITNPGINLSKAKGWGMWYSKDRAESFLSTLGGIYGQQAYLVHAKSAVRWNLTGNVNPSNVRWRPNAYNLVGFGVRTQGAPSFGEYFADSEAHKQQPIYRLVNDTWKKVTQPDAEAMRSGEAFWIYCKNGSTYQGPMGVELPLEQGVTLAGRSSSFTLRNQSSHPITATLERVSVGSAELPVSILLTAYGDPANPVKTVAVEKPASPWTQDLPTLEKGAAIAVPLKARSLEMTQSRQVGLLKITTDMGTETWVPMYGSRPDLNQ